MGMNCPSVGNNNVDKQLQKLHIKGVLNKEPVNPIIRMSFRNVRNIFIEQLKNSRLMYTFNSISYKDFNYF